MLKEEWWDYGRAGVEVGVCLSYQSFRARSYYKRISLVRERKGESSTSLNSVGGRASEPPRGPAQEGLTCKVAPTQITAQPRVTKLAEHL